VAIKSFPFFQTDKIQIKEKHKKYFTTQVTVHKPSKRQKNKEF